MINKFHNAKIHKKKEVTLWGTGKPKREFLYVDDLAESILFIIVSYLRELHSKNVELSK